MKPNTAFGLYFLDALAFCDVELCLSFQFLPLMRSKKSYTVPCFCQKFLFADCFVFTCDHLHEKSIGVHYLLVVGSQVNHVTHDPSPFFPKCILSFTVINKEISMLVLSQNDFRIPVSLFPVIQSLYMAIIIAVFIWE